ncbi:MAG: hypothetical protein GKC04_05660 [Methanomicrobiales archaeon]|nr:hypothetical protein [Methanomicrobiales archaeon]
MKRLRTTDASDNVGGIIFRNSYRVPVMKSGALPFTILCMLGAIATAGCMLADQPAVLVEYQRSGGIVGLDDRIILYDNGTTGITRHGSTSVVQTERETIETIRAIIASDAYTALSGDYLPPKPGADRISYVVTAGGKTIRTEDGAIPEGLEPLIREMNLLIADADVS